MSGIISGASQILRAPGQIARAGTDLLSLFQSPGQVAQSAGNMFQIDSTGMSWLGGTWRYRLQPGSWRGVGFILDAGETHAGRRLAIHEYPYRDTAWGEDLGKLPRRFDIQAFLVGDDVYSQRDALIAACEQPGSGTLVHPTLGSVECVLLDFATSDRRERGRMVEVTMQFMLASDVRYPGTAISTAAAIKNASMLVNSAIKGDLSTTLGSVGAFVSDAGKQIGSYTSMAMRAVNDASRIIHSVTGLAGIFGRYSTGHRSTLLSATSTVQSCLGLATTARTSVVSSVNSVTSLVNML